MILTLADLCNATPRELEKAIQIFDNMQEENYQLAMLGVSSQYKAEAKAFYSMYMKAKEFPNVVSKVYLFENGQQEEILYAYDDYEEYLQKDGCWSCRDKGAVYIVNTHCVDCIFELLKYDYLMGCVSSFHPSYGCMNLKKYGDVPWHFAKFVERTEKLYQNQL